MPFKQFFINFTEKLWRNRLLFAGFLTGVFLIGFSLTYFILTLTKPSFNTPAPTPNAFLNATPAPINEVVPEKGVYNILFIGHGGTGHPGGLLADSIITIHLNTNTKKITMLTIPRDLWVPGNHKINAAGVQSGFQNIGIELTNVTGLPFNYYVAVDFGNFVKLINALGGIDVEVPNSFSDTFYPISGEENNTCGKTGDEVNALKAKYSGFDLEKQFTCRYEQLHFDKGPAKLDGTTALKFVRSRHGDSDFGRSLRQLAVLQGIKNKLLSLQTAGKLNDVVGALIGLVKTDMNAGVVKSLVEALGDPTAYSVEQIQLTTDNLLNASKSSDGQFILIPKAGSFNFSEIKTFIKNNLN
jgi:anionic cell wall polymer biosynthesis LytR-Cps2A-Psr (LCP) family protein